MSRKKWTVQKLNKDLASTIAERYSIDPLTALLLTQRGFDTFDKLDEFFDDSEEWIDPFLLPDMDKAVERINEAIFDGERICVYGDYDCDGVTSTTILYSYLEAQGADVTYMLPERERDGYGLSNQVVDRIAATGTKLIITVDNGISSVEEAKYIKEKGMELVVTDHHLEGDELPDCVAVVDPHRNDKDCPFEDYAGCGVALKLCCAMEGSDEEVMQEFADIAALGTVADMVPLVGENRKIVLYGLKLLNTYRKPGIEAILEKAGLSEKTLDSTSISFGIAPRINAAGRMGTAERALDLLLADDPYSASEMAEEVNVMNSQRHSEEDKIFTEAIAYLQDHPELAHMPILVVSGEGWHEGVLGIVASKLLERYLRPVIVLTDKGDLCKGSARSIEGFSIYDAMNSCRDMLNTFGGHELAAGMSIKTEWLDEFREKINEYAYENASVYPETRIDCKLNPAGLSMDVLDSIRMMEPFGTGNTSPVFGLYGVVIDSVQGMGNEGRHKRLTFHKDGDRTMVNGIFFNQPEFPYQRGDKVDLVVTLGRNEYRGNVSLSVYIRDIRPAGSDDDAMAASEQLFDKMLAGRRLSGEEADRLTPDRSYFAGLYRYLKANEGVPYSAYEYIHRKVYPVEDESTPLCKTRVTLLAMRELGLLTTDDEGRIHIPDQETKVDLSDAPVLQKLNATR
ncbi:MAG: single-stranded-DNA-specific exonuclease RecJ [Acutalibacteraceae bacterium]|nr:single-stranded-DNA-specific exonuclease RecJ [Acutalibacteraceae bacterium]